MRVAYLKTRHNHAVSESKALCGPHSDLSTAAFQPTLLSLFALGWQQGPVRLLSTNQTMGFFKNEALVGRDLAAWPANTLSISLLSVSVSSPSLPPSLPPCSASASPSSVLRPF